jgi:hypothetical protein
VSTREFSNKQEKAVARLLEGQVNPNSGAGKWRKGDVRIPEASMLIECKTCMQDKTSFSVKQEWIEKNKDEAFSCGLCNSAIAFNFGPDKPNYFVINERLMQFLVDNLKENGY